MEEDLDMQCDTEPTEISIYPEPMFQGSRNEVEADYEIEKLIEAYEEHMSCNKVMANIRHNLEEERKVVLQVIKNCEKKVLLYRDLIHELFETKEETFNDHLFHRLNNLLKSNMQIEGKLGMVQESVKKLENKNKATAELANKMESVVGRVYQRLKNILFEKDSLQTGSNCLKMGEEKKEAESESLAKDLEQSNAIIERMQAEVDVLKDLLEIKDLSLKPLEDDDSSINEKQLTEKVEKNGNDGHKDDDDDDDEEDDDEDDDDEDDDK